jgi:hypothetical protein
MVKARQTERIMQLIPLINSHLIPNLRPALDTLTHLDGNATHDAGNL